MTPAERIAATGCPWIQPGALSTKGDRVIKHLDGHLISSGGKVFDGVRQRPVGTGDWLPDLTDPATWGVLLSLLPGGWWINCPRAYEWGWQVMDNLGQIKALRDTKLDALIAALEAHYENP